jgi:hypothetical protein
VIERHLEADLLSRRVDRGIFSGHGANRHVLLFPYASEFDHRVDWSKLLNDDDYDHRLFFQLTLSWNHF